MSTSDIGIRHQDFIAFFSIHEQFKMIPQKELCDITLAAENKRRRRVLALTPAQRLSRFEALQAKAMQILTSNPPALAAFHHRNRRRRRQSQVQLLLAQIRSQ